MALTKKPSPFASKAAPSKAVAKKAGAATKKVAPKRATNGDADDDDYDGVRITSGWGGAERLREETSDFTPSLSMDPGEEVVVRFLDDEPYANVATHWIEERRGKKMRLSFPCHGPNCPLCAIGHKPKVTYNFNVAKLTDGDPLVYSWNVTKRTFDKLKTAHNHPRYGPLSSRFYTVTRIGKGTDTNYDPTVLKRDGDLEEEYPDLHAPDADEIAALPRLTTEDAKRERVSHKQMEELAAEISDDFVPED